MGKNFENELPKIRVIIRDDKAKNAQGKFTLNYAVRYEGKTIKKSTGLISILNYGIRRKGKLSELLKRCYEPRVFYVKRSLILTDTS